MVLTVSKLEKFIKHALDGSQAAPISSRELVNQVGEWFCSQQSWRFNKRRARLKVRQSRTLSTSTYNAEALTIKQVGLFADYTHTPGDIIESEALATLPNTTPGEHLIKRKLDADTIELESPLHRNMIEWTEVFADGLNSSYWTEVNAPISYVSNTTGTTDPLGGNTADEISDDNASLTASIRRDFTTTSTPEKLTNGKSYCFSVHTKQILGDTQGMILTLSHIGGTKAINLTFNTTSGTANAPVVGGSAVTGAGFETLTGGWYRPWVTMKFDSQDSLTIGASITPRSSAGGTGAHYFWGTQFEEVADGSTGPSKYERRDDDTGVWTPATFTGLLPNNVIPLPGNVAAVLAVATNTETLDGFRWTDQESMAYDRIGRRLFDNYGLRGAVVSYAPSGGGATQYRLELDPNQNSTDELEVRYISGWNPVSTDTEDLPIPADGWLDGLFTQAVIAWAQGLDAEDEASLYVRLDTLAQSSMWNTHVGRDAGVQSDMGPTRGSDINRRYDGGRSRFHDISTSA